MALQALQVQHIRNLKSVRLDDLSRVNVFYGANGSGKTSVLEAIHVLGMARSFRGSSIKALISHDEPRCTVFGASKTPGSQGATPLGVQRTRQGEALIKVGGQVVRAVAELAEYLPLQVITADSFNLLTGPPGGRRRFLDWGVFHVEHAFFGEWQRFQRCIKQRNMLLRRGNIDPRQLVTWTREIATSGEAINAFRAAYFGALEARFATTIARLAPSLSELALRFRRGWDAGRSYAEALEHGRASDIEQGYTHAGPQRADMRVTIAGHMAADTLSRGQQKLVICALKLAQGQLMSELGRGHCLYLIDDLPAELDEHHSRLVCELLAEMDAQVFITCVEQDEIRSVWPEGSELAMFHVEHGAVRPV